MRLHTLMLASLLSFSAQGLLAAESGIALKADQLRATPFSDGKTVGTLNKNDKVDIVGKQGAWLQVKTNKSTGWVRLLTVKRNSSGNALSGIADVATGRAGTGKVVSTTGIRGLSAEDLKTAPYSETEIKNLDGFAVSANDAKSFAKSGALTSNSTPYFKGAQ